MIKNIQTLWLMVYFWSINPVLFVLTLDRSVLLEHFKFSYFFKAFHVRSVSLITAEKMTLPTRTSKKIFLESFSLNVQLEIIQFLWSLES